MSASPSRSLGSSSPELAATVGEYALTRDVSTILDAHRLRFVDSPGLPVCVCGSSGSERCWEPAREAWLRGHVAETVALHVLRLLDPGTPEWIVDERLGGAEALAQLPGGDDVPEGFAPILARYVRRSMVRETDMGPAKLLTAYHELGWVTSINLRRAVDRARQLGASWQEIGAALRMTKQAAQQRYGAKVPSS